VLYLHSYVVGDSIQNAVSIILWRYACYWVWCLQILNMSFIFDCDCTVQRNRIFL